MTDITCRACVHFEACKISNEVESWIAVPHFNRDLDALSNIIATVADSCKIYEGHSDIVISAMRELLSQASDVAEYKDAAVKMEEMLDKIQEVTDGNTSNV